MLKVRLARKQPPPLCESFLGESFRQWFLSDDPIAKGNTGARTVCFGIVNDLPDETVNKLAAWASDGFPHLCVEPL